MNAESVKYSNNKSSVTNVQDAIDELYMKAKEIVKVSNYKYLEEDSSKEEIGKDKIVVGYKKTNPTVTCEYGENKTYGNVGAINNNKCIMNNLKKGTKYYYKIKASVGGTESYIEGFKRTLGDTTIIEASDIEYSDKTIEEALDELYNKVNSNSISSNFEEIRESENNITENSIEISYIYKEASIRCEYGKVENGNVVYNKTGNINTVNKTCTLGESEALEANTTYSYKIISIDSNGVETYMIGEKTTEGGSGATLVETNTLNGVEQVGLIGIVYLDPTDLTKACDEEAYIADLNKYDTTHAEGSKISTGQTSGCMKWYVYDTVTKSGIEKHVMLLDHNTYAKGVFNNAVNAFNSLKNTWSNIGESNIRMITFSELKKISNNSTWSINGSRYYFNSTTSAGTSAYKWLFDRTSGCLRYGCDISDTTNYGYWTSSCTNGEENVSSCSYDVWTVDEWADAYRADLNNNGFGVRPVIEVPTNLFS